MRVSRTPLRISFFGGGTDYPQWFNDHGGAVLGTTIDKYCYVTLHDGTSHFCFDLPNKSGLGSSSAYTIGLLRACSSFDIRILARLATTWEFDKMGGNVGYQDQYLCALGGFRELRFNSQDVIDRLLDPSLVAPLQDYLMLFNTHQYRKASDLVKYQIAEMDKHEQGMTRIMQMVTEGLTVIRNQDWKGFGTLLNDGWMIKRELSPYVSTSFIDSIYERAKLAGAIGGKLLGGGGGGFIIFVVEPEKQEAVKMALEELTYTPFKFENEGSVVLYKDD